MNIPSVTIPIGKKGSFEIKREYVEPRYLFGKRSVPKGEYTFLYRGDVLVMSDTPDEKRDHLDAVICAKGNCLIAGLGIGMILNTIAMKPEVSHIDVIEKEQDVIDLVAPYYDSQFPGKISYHHADIFDFKSDPGITYDMAWFDIWDYLSIDNLEEMSRLHRKFGKKAKWKGSWGKEELLRERKWQR